MIDLYAIIAVGVGLFIGFIPLIRKEFRRRDFLIDHYIDKNAMSQAEIDECKKLGYATFMKKVEEESKWRKKNRISYKER